MPLKTLFLNPPSFENFDGGAGSRWPATREIESYWYPVWLAYPAGMLEGARLLDAPPHYVSADETIKIAQDYEFFVLFTSSRSIPSASLRFPLHDPWLPGAVHVLPVAADSQRPPLAQTLFR